MGVHLLFYLILLLWLIQAVISQEAYRQYSRCHEKCGDVFVPFPFGIKSGCYSNSWFRVTCNQTAHGPKPFITRTNMELLGSFRGAGDVAVNNPVTYLNCGNKVNNGTTPPAGVNLRGSPFFFSSRFNVFGSVGCGNLVTFFRNNQTEDPIGGCLQQRCGDLTSKLGGCYADIISENPTSYTATMTEITDPGKREYRNKCTSAFIFDLRMLNSSGPDLEFPRDISIDTTQVTASLEWNPVKCDLGAALCKEVKPVKVQAAATPSGISHKSVCTERCGNVDIPYPFGITDGCYMSEWFRVTCIETGDGPKPFIRSIKMQMLNFSFPQGIVVVNNSVTFSSCRNKSEDNNGISVNLTGTPFFFSHIFNRFVSVGCGTLVTILGNRPDHYPLGGCLLPLCSDTVSSNISCLTKIPPALSSFAANVVEIYPRNGSKRSCGSAFMVDVSLLGSLGIIIPPYLNGMSSWTDAPTTLQLDTPKLRHVPTTLQWGIQKAGLCELNEGSNTFCSPDGHHCWSKIRSRHLCVCSVNLDNDYASDVCQEIGKCGDRKYRYCYMLCLNAPGNYCSSACPDRYEYSSEKNLCNPIDFAASQPTKPKKSRNSSIFIGFSASFGTAFSMFCTCRIIKALNRRKKIKLKEKYFKRNGGLLLQRQLSCNEGNVETIRLFNSKELDKATDYYNQNRILGQGGQGTVYKGMLIDGSIVAIKKYKMEEEKIFDEKKLQQFINEVIILSQINHRNVVKLLGCCLEAKVPLLVYEFIPNGTLSQLIQDQNQEFPMTWEMRLRIAVESASALSYMHSAASVPIYHRDIKSSNILLDDKHRAKVSDFGTSRSVALEQTHVTTRVQGTFGYLDPEYFRSSQFTEKSDVYSFGVVLVELLTGQKPVSSTHSKEVRSLVSIFLLSMKENSLFDILDPVVMKDCPEQEIIAVAKLAKRSLNLNGNKRPTMRQVAMELERIRASEEANAFHQSVDEDSEADDATEPWDIASCSTSRAVTNDIVTLPLYVYSKLVSNNTY